MNEPAIPPRVIVDKNTLLSLGVGITLGGIIYFAGVYSEKLNRLDGLGIERRLATIESDVKAIARRVGVPLREVETTGRPIRASAPISAQERSP